MSSRPLRSGKLEKEKRAGRIFQNVAPESEIAPTVTHGRAKDTARSHMDRLPRRWESKDANENDRTVQEIRMLKALQSKNSKLLGPTGIIGQRHFDRDLVDRVTKMKEAEFARRQENLMEEIIYDPSDPWQRQKLDAMMPEFKSSRMKVAEDQIEQFAFLTKMGMKAEFGDAEEFHRVMLILGGGEKLICFNHIFAAAQSSPAPGLFGLFKDGDKKARFPLSYQDDEWAVQAGTANSDIQKLLIQLAKSVLHLFPRLLAGKYNPYADDASDVIRSKDAKNAKQLQAYAVEYCQDMDPASYFLDAVDKIGDNSRPGLSFYLPPKFTAGKAPTKVDG